MARSSRFAIGGTSGTVPVLENDTKSHQLGFYSRNAYDRLQWS